MYVRVGFKISKNKEEEMILNDGKITSDANIQFPKNPSGCFGGGNSIQNIREQERERKKAVRDNIESQIALSKQKNIYKLLSLHFPGATFGFRYFIWIETGKPQI